MLNSKQNVSYFAKHQKKHQFQKRKKSHSLLFLITGAQNINYMTLLLYLVSDGSGWHNETPTINQTNASDVQEFDFFLN